MMDRQKAYVGEHSPMVKLEAATPHGIQEAGLGVRKGRKYSGRVILAADPRRGSDGQPRLGTRSGRPADHPHQAAPIRVRRNFPCASRPVPTRMTRGWKSPELGRERFTSALCR